MSVQTQINRISGNISSALAAIADKGVTVPSGSTSDALAELIASIEAGGGASGFAKVTKGSVDITSFAGQTTLTIEHGLRQTPDIVVLYDGSGFRDNLSIGACIMLPNGEFVNAGYDRGNQSSSRQGVYFGTNASINETSFTVQGKLYYGGSSSVSNIHFTHGLSYIWIAGVYA